MKKTRTLQKVNLRKTKQTPRYRERAAGREAGSAYAVYQRVKAAPPKQIGPSDIAVLQRTIGNRAVGQLLQMKSDDSTAVQLQKASCPDCMEEERQPMLQRQVEEEEEIQPMLQRQVEEEEEEEIQPMLQRQVASENTQSIGEAPESVPTGLRRGVESLSGTDMSDVSVYRNSNKPKRVGALAYTQGTNIYVAPGQEEHLPHEAWHAAQQKSGRVHPTSQAFGLPMNDDDTLEREADRMGRLATARTSEGTVPL